MRSREAIAQHDQGVARTVADCDRHLIACARATLQGSLGGPQRSLWGEGPKHVFLMAARAPPPQLVRQSGVWGKSVDLGGRRIIKKKRY